MNTAYRRLIGGGAALAAFALLSPITTVSANPTDSTTLGSLGNSTVDSPYGRDNNFLKEQGSIGTDLTAALSAEDGTYRIYFDGVYDAKEHSYLSQQFFLDDALEGWAPELWKNHKRPEPRATELREVDGKKVLVATEGTPDNPVSYERAVEIASSLYRQNPISAHTQADGTVLYYEDARAPYNGNSIEGMITYEKDGQLYRVSPADEVHRYYELTVENGKIVELTASVEWNEQLVSERDDSHLANGYWTGSKYEEPNPNLNGRLQDSWVMNQEQYDKYVEKRKDSSGSADYEQLRGICQQIDPYPYYEAGTSSEWTWTDRTQDQAHAEKGVVVYWVDGDWRTPEEAKELLEVRGKEPLAVSGPVGGMTKIVQWVVDLEQ